MRPWVHLIPPAIILLVLLGLAELFDIGVLRLGR
ncbi:hypothetical protein AEGHOMDF_0461 [Methylobacterium soli]|nr:hypothetical protein AEGHOMDF_0461 [Methylobacterium soli]